MIFRVCEHYYNDDLSNTSDICFICYEYDTDLEIRPSSLRQYLKTQNCECDGLIHKNCLDMWSSKNNKCPICRTILTTSNNKSLVAIFLINKAKTLSYAFIKIAMYCFLFYSYIEFYLSMTTTKHITKKYSSPSYHYDSPSHQNDYNSPQEL